MWVEGWSTAHTTSRAAGLSALCKARLSPSAQGAWCGAALRPSLLTAGFLTPSETAGSACCQQQREQLETNQAEGLEPT